MITDDSMLEDSFNDDVLIAIKLLNVELKWTKKKYDLKNSLINLLNAEGYISFSVTNVEQYKISRVGQSYLYDVPMHKRGHLSIFRGKRVRIVCSGSGRNSFRELMAKDIGDK